MGDNVLESQAKNTEKRRARAAADRQQGRLFVRSDTVIDEFTVDVISDKSVVKIGDVLFCFPGKGEAPVDVVHESTRIGTVNAGGGEVLRERVQESGCQAVVVQSVCEITDTVKVQMKMD